MDQEHKACIACKEAIKQDARKCPHCHQIQSGAAALQTSPVFGWAVGTIILVSIATISYKIWSDMSDMRTPPDIEIGEGKVRISTNPEGAPSVSCFTSIKNRGIRYVSDPSLQAEFFDSSGEVIDVHFAKHKLSLMPHIEAIGRVTGVPSANPKTYASCKVVLLSVQ